MPPNCRETPPKLSRKRRLGEPDEFDATRRGATAATTTANSKSEPPAIVAAAAPPRRVCRELPPRPPPAPLLEGGVPGILAECPRHLAAVPGILAVSRVLRRCVLRILMARPAHSGSDSFWRRVLGILAHVPLLEGGAPGYVAQCPRHSGRASDAIWQAVLRIIECPGQHRKAFWRCPRHSGAVSQAFRRMLRCSRAASQAIWRRVPGILAVSQAFWQSAPGIPALSHAYVRCLRPSDGTSRIPAACPRHSGGVRGLASPRWSCSGCQGTRERCIPASQQHWSSSPSTVWQAHPAVWAQPPPAGALATTMSQPPCPGGS